MTAVPLPPEFGFGFVVGRMLEVVADQSGSTDPYPDGKPIELKKAVAFTPAQATRISPTPGLPEPSTAFLQDPIVADLDQDGYLSINQLRGVWLYTGVWNVTFNSVLGWKPFQISVTAEYTLITPLDLFSADPYTPPPGVTTTVLEMASTVNDGDVLIRQGSMTVGLPQDVFKTNVSGLAKVAFSGLFEDLVDAPSYPTLSTVATSGLYSDLEGTPNLATVATSGLYSDLGGKPNLATVATSGQYSDLGGKPTLGSAAGASTSDFAPSSFVGVSTKAGNTASIGPDGKIYVPASAGSSTNPAYDPTVSAATGLVSWHRCDSGVGLDSTQAKVLTWTGKTAAANVFTATAGQEPFLSPTKVNGATVNAIRGYSAKQALMTSSIVPATGANPSTMLFVMEGITNTYGSGWQWAGGYGNPSNRNMRNIATRMNGISCTGYSFNSDDYFGPIVNNKRTIVIGIYDGTTVSFWVDGILHFKLTDTSGINTSNTGMVLFNGPSKNEASSLSILELITWSRALTDTEVSTAFSTLKLYYGVA